MLFYYQLINNNILLNLIIKKDDLELEKLYMTKDWRENIDFHHLYYTLLTPMYLDNPSAQHLLGYMYTNGFGVVKDIDMGCKYYYDSANNKNSNSIYNLAVKYQNDGHIKKSIDFFTEAANMGHISSCMKLGKHYEDNDFNLSSQYYAIAAESHYHPAQDALLQLLYNHRFTKHTFIDLLYYCFFFEKSQNYIGRVYVSRLLGEDRNLIKDHLELFYKYRDENIELKEEIARLKK